MTLYTEDCVLHFKISFYTALEKLLHYSFVVTITAMVSSQSLLGSQEDILPLSRKADTRVTAVGAAFTILFIVSSWQL